MEPEFKVNCNDCVQINNNIVRSESKVGLN